MAEATVKIAKNTPDVRIVYKNARAIAQIMKLENGKYRVTKLYEMEVKDFDGYSAAREEAIAAKPLMVPTVVVKNEQAPVQEGQKRKRGRPRKDEALKQAS